MSNNSWNCPNCGTAEITSKFCPECGTKRPEPETWECPNCGTKEIKSKFCPECGTKRPETGTTQKTEAESAKPQEAGVTESFNIGPNVEIARIITQIEQIASTHKITLPPTFRKIKARSNDPMLYVGLIGEFSSGKSTLVNAWLGDDLLKTDILQATTAAPTLLKDSSEYQISTLMKNGDVIDSAKTGETEKFKATFLDYLHKVSADENYSKDIKLVSLSYPNEVLRNKGFALIDTPGANADNERHKEISGWAVEELCDVAIVIIPANIPYSESLNEFIKTYLDKSFKKCVFVITKVDSIRHESELKSLVSTVRTRVETSLEIEVPEIITFSPRLYLDALTGENEVAERKQHFISEFEENTAKLFDLLHKKRDEYISFTLSEILKTLISEIQEKLKVKETEYERRQKLVAANMLPDLNRWFSDRYDKLKASMEKEYEETHTKTENWLASYKSDLMETILQDFNSINEADQVEGFMKENFLVETYFNNSTSEISDYLESAIITNQELSETKFLDLNKEFSNVYRNLATIDPNLPASIRIQNKSLESYSFSDINKASEELASEKKGFQIGAGVIGAGIGIFFGGPLGAAIGASVGRWIGKFLVSADDVKAKYLPSLKQLIDSYFANISNVFSKELSKTLSADINTLSQIIDDYKKSYSLLISEIQKKEKEEENELSRNAEEVGKNTRNLSEIIKSLENPATVKITSTDKFSFLHELPEIMRTEPLTSDSNTDEIAVLLGGASSVAKHTGRFSSDSQSANLPDIKTAEDLYLQGNFDESFKTFKQLAEAGNERAMFFLSQFYESGLGNVPLNKKEENKWSNCAVAMKYPLALLDEILSELTDKNKKSVDNNPKEIIKEVWQMADKGDIFAQSYLGHYYFFLYLSNSDKDAVENETLIEKSIKLLKNPAAQGEFLAQFSLGILYTDHLYANQENYKQGFELFYNSAEKGNTAAQYRVGMAYLNGQGVEENPFKAFEWFMKAAEKGNAEAENMVGMAYFNGNGIQQNDNKAFEWFMKAAEQKLPTAMDNVACCYENGYGIEKNEQLAFEWAMKSAKSGNAGGQDRTGLYYQNGFGVKQNNFEAFKWYMRAAEQGNAEAQNSVGMAYLFGEGTQKDDNEAFEWFMYAAEQGLPVAMNNVAFCYENGYGVEENAQSVFEWYMKAAETGDASGQYKTGMCYRTGFGTQQNHSEAFKWFMKAAEQEYAEAQNMVGMAYSNGERTQQNLSEAFQWFMKAAKQELPVAMNNVAFCYENGNGIKQNYQKAFNWYLKAAEAGYPDAQYQVGLYYYNGVATTQDKKTAFEWIHKAVEQGHEEAKNFSEQEHPFESGFYS
jgi:TPR repeat protein/GTPase Era involved in 16S rRNA processing/ribosomal protein L32